MLTLPIKKKWFDMILSGEKKEEYRDIKQYYNSRLLPLFGVFWCENKLVKGNGAVKDSVPICFKNGYSSNAPKIKAVCHLSSGFGKEEWGAEPGKKYFILGIEKVHKL